LVINRGSLRVILTIRRRGGVRKGLGRKTEPVLEDERTKEAVT